MKRLIEEQNQGSFSSAIQVLKIGKKEIYPLLPPPSCSVHCIGYSVKNALET